MVCAHLWCSWSSILLLRVEVLLNFAGVVLPSCFFLVIIRSFFICGCLIFRAYLMRVLLSPFIGPRQRIIFACDHVVLGVFLAVLS